MESLVLKLQADCMDQNQSVTTILREAWAVAKKLDLRDFVDVLHKELNGYFDADDVPNYRVLTGELKALNPSVGYIPVLIRDPAVDKSLTQKPVLTSIPEIEDLLSKPNASSSMISQFPSSVATKIMELFEMDFVPSLHVPSSAMRRIVETVRNTVLNWSLELEKNKIFGDGLSFSQSEKQAASTHISNSTVILGDMNSSVIQSQIAGNASASINDDHPAWQLVKEIIDHLNDNRDELNALLDSTQDLDNSVSELSDIINDKKKDAGKASRLLKGIKDILSSAAKSLIASGIIYQIEQVLPQLVASVG